MGVRGWVGEAALGGDAGGPSGVVGLGEHLRTKLSGFGVWPWELLKTILIGWPSTCPMCLGVQKIVNGQQQHGKWI